jgi:hypothetical protein
MEQYPGLSVGKCPMNVYEQLGNIEHGKEKGTKKRQAVHKPHV